METLINSLFQVSKGIRYIAIYTDGKLISSSGTDLTNASSSESDKYEELIVNPTLIKLLTQRGNIDCGGLKYALIRYGHFFVYIKPLVNGHINVGINLDEDPLQLIPTIDDVMSKYNL